MEKTVTITKIIGSGNNCIYGNNRSPLIQKKLIKLPPGSIKPKGWLKHQIDLMLDGITGRLYEYGAFFDKDSNGWLYDVDKGWEEVPYWFRGFYPLAVITENKRCLEVAQQYIEHALKSQDEDGYFGPSHMKRINADNGQIITDLWPHMLMLHPMISYYEYTKDERIIHFLRKFFEFCRDIPEGQFIPADIEGNSGWGGGKFGSFYPIVQYNRAGDMLPHLFWYYNQTGEEWVQDLIIRFFNHHRPAWDEWLDHHVVNFTQRFAYDAIFYQLSGNEDHLLQTEYWYNQHMTTWGRSIPRGAFAADERIRPGCTDPRQGFETCGMIEFPNNFYLLADITGEPKYADRSEDLLLNHFPSSYTPDFKAVRYLSPSNLPMATLFKHHPFTNGKIRSDRSYVAYTPHNRCCGHNLGIGWTFYSDNLFKATADNGLAFFMYGACDLKAKAGEKEVPVSICTDTSYPFSGKVEMTVNPSTSVLFPLYLRIPKWSMGATLLINDEQVLETKEKETWICIKRIWNENDRVSISFDMEISYTKWPVNHSITVDRGPLSYSVKIEEEFEKHLDIGTKAYLGSDDWPNYSVMPKSPWNYGLCLDDENKLKNVKLHIDENLQENPWTSDSSPIEITLSGQRIRDWTIEDDTASELQRSPIRSQEPIETIKMIPLGCARLRMACLPVIKNDKFSREWEKTPDHVDFDKRSKNRFDDPHTFEKPKTLIEA